MVKNNEFNLKHKRQTLDDFNCDRHRFSFCYNGERREASCYGAVGIVFDYDYDDNAATLSPIPDDKRWEIAESIFDLVDKNEGRWSVPKGAQAIADAYCKANFA